MLNQKKLSELIKDEEIDNFYLLVKKCERRLNKNEKPYYYFELADKTTSIVANYWNNFNDTEMSEIKNVRKILSSINTEFNLWKYFKDFRDRLPKGSYSYGMINMIKI